ncbi:isochorismatase family cysteine hydrolase [Streptomyces sp. NPDC004528]|uniref:isochorismatase family cysteine hydrolase n=1 Tax=Streptomyces sp. NPDC004528 TaxID=3154550 RepID=UPI0033A09383
MLFTHRNPEMQLDKQHTALVLADIQNDFLSENGSYYPLISDVLKTQGTLEHIEQLLKAAKEYDFFVVHSPHYYYPSDGQWVAPGNAVGDYLAGIDFVRRADPVSLDGFVGSGADYPEHLKKYLMDGRTANTSPHKMLSTESNDVVKQLRMRRVEKVIMAGPVGNLCLESHMRDLVEAGFEIAVVRDAVAAGSNEEGDGYTAAMVNYRFLTSAMWTTEEAVDRMKAAAV